MTIRHACWTLSCLAWASIVCGTLTAGEAKTAALSGTNGPAVENAVEFFQAMEDGTIAAKFIAKNASEARVIIENKTGQPVNIRLPEAFAGVPVLAQFGGGGGGMGGGGGGSQGMGGGMGGGGMGGGGMGGGGGGGMFNIPPERTRKIQVATVCLDYGKPDPNPKLAYEIKPVESYVTRAPVIEMLKAFGRGEIAPGAAQAAAWHLNNDLSWEELAKKMRGPKDPRFGRRVPYFSSYELQAAMTVAKEAKRLAKEAETVPGKQDSMSR